MSKIEHGKLLPEHERALIKQYMFIKEELDAKYIVDFLLSHRVLDQDDKEEVLSGRTRKERTEILLNKILHAGPGDAFEIFLKSLESNRFEHVAQRIKEYNLSNVKWEREKSSLLKSDRTGTKT